MTSQQISVGGVTMRWEEVGEGPPVVFVHGIPTGPALWRRVVPLVSGARCLSWEMVGYGRSIGEGAGRDISVARQAAYLHGWLDAIGVEDAVLVGHDLGGGVAQIAAVERPDRCAGLVLVNSIAYDSWPIPSVKAMRSAGAMVERLPAALFRPVFAGFLRLGHDDGSVARESIAAHWAPYADAGGAPAFVRQIQSLRTDDTLAVVDRLPTLRVPARVVWGAADQFQKVRFGERLSRDLSAPLTRLNGARHFVPEDHPDAVAEAVVAIT
ncbi:MAG: alpha/beta fold hydrolase [Actinomycetota bacterium]|jgi:pimeloyl-ACP methyl ester carboxylesterase